jgi:hypothetical protein
MDSKRVVCIVSYDNRLPITTDVSHQVKLAMDVVAGWACHGVTTKVVTLATMFAPLGGVNQIIIDLSVPTGTTDAAIANAVAYAITILDLPFCPTIVVTSTTVYASSPAPTPGPPNSSSTPANGNP